MLDLVWLIPALPLAGFLLLLVVGRRLGEPLAGWLATADVRRRRSSSSVDRVRRPARQAGRRPRSSTQTLFTWLPAGGFNVDVGFLVDPLSITMCLFVTGVGALIHLYSIGYMHGDPKFSKFFLYLNLFVFSMLMLVLGDNLLVTFLGWEGVGACSYFLISFWFTQARPTPRPARRPSSPTASVTGASCSAMFLTFERARHRSTTPTSMPRPRPAASRRSRPPRSSLLFFVGAVGKSAQLPLYLWLPDAMAGPTPVSALIHAATMVTAGVYLMVRINPLLRARPRRGCRRSSPRSACSPRCSPPPIAVAQNDIKKVLAYSTVSQLGYMFLAVGSRRLRGRDLPHDHPRLLQGAAVPRRRLGDPRHARRAGHAPHGRPAQATCRSPRPRSSSAGWPSPACRRSPASGRRTRSSLDAWDKERAWKALWVVGLVTALLTAFYMSRQVFMIFFGEARWRRPTPRRPPTSRRARGDAEPPRVRPTTTRRTSRRGR